MAFGLDFFDIVPGLRLAGDSLAFAYKFTKKGGQGDGLKGLEIGLTDDPTVKLIEGEVSGYEQTADVDAAYQFLVDGGLTELVPGLAIGIDSLSSIETGDKAIRLSLAGSQPVLVFRYANVQAVSKVGDGGYTWDLPEATFTALRTAAEGYTSDLKTKVDEMIAARLAADGVLQGLITDQGVADAAARTAIQADVDANQAAAESADAALSARIDVLEADPTTAAAVAAVQSDVDANEADSDAADAALSGRLDVLEADPVTKAYVDNIDTVLQGNIDSEAGTRAAADSALDGRLDVLEADPTTAAAVAAVQSDVDQNEADGDAADAALSGRLDVLEADPTTATAVAAVQSDVDANETAANTALALRALLDGSNIPGPYNNDADAATAGVGVGAIYKNSNGTIHWRVS